MKQHTTIATW